jgi:hypothetical protein
MLKRAVFTSVAQDYILTAESSPMRNKDDVARTFPLFISTPLICISTNQKLLSVTKFITSNINMKRMFGGEEGDLRR